MEKMVYISIPMSASVEILELGNAILSHCNAIGLKPYSLRLAPDPDAPDISAGEIIESRAHPLLFSDLLIVYVGTYSLEVIWDLRTAKDEKMPVIALYLEGTRVEQVELDTLPIVEVIEFGDIGEALLRLETAICIWQWEITVGFKEALTLPHLGRDL